MKSLLNNYSVQNISKSYKHIQALKNISLEINRPECIGLIGPNGAGKTTLLKIFAGILTPTTGSVFMHSDDIGYLAQFPKFFPRMSARETLKFYAQLSQMDEDEIEKRCDEVLEIVKLTKYQNRKVSSFSGGMLQKLGVAQAIIHKPKIVFLDEPAASLDPVGRKEVLDLIKVIKKDSIVILSTHILSDAENVCDRFWILKEGNLLDDFYISKKSVDFENYVAKVQVNSNKDEWISGLKNFEFINDITVDNNNVSIKLISNTLEVKNTLTKSLVDSNVDFNNLVFTEFSIEDYFLELMGDKHE